MSVTMTLNTHTMPSMIDTRMSPSRDTHLIESDDDITEYEEHSNGSPPERIYLDQHQDFPESPNDEYPASNSSVSSQQQQPIQRNAADSDLDRPSMLSDRPSMLSEPTFQDRPSMLAGEENQENGLPDLDETSDNPSPTNLQTPQQLSKPPPQKRGKRKKYQKYTPEDRIAIGKYCFEHGPAAARKAFQDRYPEMSESVTRGFRDKYKQLIGESAVYEFEQKKQRELQNSYNPPLRGRPRKYKLANGQQSPIQNLPPPLEQHQKITNNINNNNNNNVEKPHDYQKIPSEIRESLLLTEYNNNNIEVQHRKRSPFAYTLDDKLRIARFYAQHGVMDTLNNFYREYHDLDESKILEFYKQYKLSLSGYASPTHHQPQVFVLEGDHHVTMATTKASESIVTYTDQTQRLSPNHQSDDLLQNPPKLEEHRETRQASREMEIHRRHSSSSSSSKQQQISPSYQKSPPSSIYKSHHSPVINGHSPPLRRHSPSIRHHSPPQRDDSPVRKSPRQHSPSQMQHHRHNSPPQRQHSPFTSPHRTYSRHSPTRRSLSPPRRPSPTRAYSPSRAYSPTRRVSPPRGYPPIRRHSPPGVHRNIHPSTMMSSKLSTAPSVIHYPAPNSPTYMNGQYRNADSRGLKRDYEASLHMNGYGSVEYPYDRKHPYGQKSLFDRKDIYVDRKDGYVRKPKEISPPGQGRSKRYKYQKYTPEDRYNIGKLCNDIGLGATVKVYREQFPRLNESVVRTFRNKYRELLEKGNGVPPTEAIERKPSRRSVSTLIENEVVSQLKQFKSSNIELSENFVIAVADNIIATKHTKEASTIKSIITKEWANSLLWKHKLLEKPSGNVHGVCCERCKTQLVCPKCPQ